MVKKSLKTNEMKAAFLYTRRFCKTDLEWPYNLIKIHLVPNDENIAFLFPKRNSKADLAMNYSKKTASLVTINKIGGNMGPRLNYPKSVTEYWNKSN
jgi:hypothetical protein